MPRQVRVLGSKNGKAEGPVCRSGVFYMNTEANRSSERIEVELPIQVSGTDCMGHYFLEKTHTGIISRHGAKILLSYKLVPEQEVNVLSLPTGKEAEARIVGKIGMEGQKYWYGIQFLDGDANLWGIEFPAISESKGAVGRLVLECLSCKSRELSYLDEFEVEVLEANQRLQRHCKGCGDTRFWKKSFVPEPIVSAPPPSTVSKKPKERRRDRRRPIRVKACIRSHKFGDDLVQTRDVSRRGLSFASPWDYVKGWEIEVAVPYSQGGGNIFLPARIVRVQFLEEEATRLYGVAYDLKWS